MRVIARGFGRRPLVKLLALAFGVLLFAAFLPWSVSDSLLRRTVIRQIETATGLKAEEIGRATITLLPHLRLRCENVAIRDGHGAIAIETKAIEGDLRPLSLAFGHLELESLSLDTPTIFVDLDGRPFERVGAIARAFQASGGSPQANVADRARLAKLVITSGLVRLQSRTLKFETLLQDVDAVLDWRRIGSPARLTGSAVWRGHATDFEFAAAKPSALLRGEPSNLTVALHGDAANLEADGVVAGAGGLRFDGSVKADTPSLRELARIFKFSVPLPGRLDDAWLDGSVKITGPNIAVENAKLGLDGNAFEGSLAMMSSGDHTAWSGTLATDRLALDPVAERLPNLRGGDGQWSAEPFDLAAFGHDDLDLRISASHLRLASFQVEDAALSVLVRKSRVEISLDEAQAYQGALRLRIVGAIKKPKLDLTIDGTFSHIDVGSLLATAGFGGWLWGTGAGEFALQDSGGNAADLIDSLGGHLALTVTQGAINGIDVEQALRRVERRPLLSASDVHSGTTSFDAAHAAAAIDNGTLSISQGAISGPGAQIAFDGNIALADGSVALNAHATQTGEQGSKRVGGPELTFAVNGSWEDLRVEPDADSLIRRSDAAAPLFMLRHTGIEPTGVSSPGPSSEPTP